MRTLYGFFGNCFRYQGLILSLFFYLRLIVFPLPYRYSDIVTDRLIIISILFGVWGIIHLWVYPVLEITKKGLKVIRFFGIIKYEVSWGKFEMHKKVRTFTKYGLAGLDPRYLLIELKDVSIFDRVVKVVPFFDKYDDFVKKLTIEIKSGEQEEQGAA